MNDDDCRLGVCAWSERVDGAEEEDAACEVPRCVLSVRRWWPFTLHFTHMLFSDLISDPEATLRKIYLHRFVVRIIFLWHSSTLSLSLSLSLSIGTPPCLKRFKLICQTSFVTIRKVISRCWRALSWLVFFREIWRSQILFGAIRHLGRRCVKQIRGVSHILQFRRPYLRKKEMEKQIKMKRLRHFSCQVLLCHVISFLLCLLVLPPSLSSFFLVFLSFSFFSSWLLSIDPVAWWWRGSMLGLWGIGGGLLSSCGCVRMGSSWRWAC